MWDDVKSGSGGSGDKKELKFLATPAGNTVFRILDEQPKSRWTHWVNRANGCKGANLPCLGKDCPVCAHMKQAKAAGTTALANNRKMHAINVLDVASGEIKIMDKGSTVFEQLHGLMEIAGDLRNYNVTLRVSGSGRDTSYVAVPMPPTAVPAYDKANLYDLEEIFKPFTVEQTTRLFNGETYKDVFGETQETVAEPVVVETHTQGDAQPVVDFSNPQS